MSVPAGFRATSGGYVEPVSSHGVSTLPDARPPEKVRRDRNLRTAGALVLILFVGAGMVGLLGVRTVTVSTSADGVDLTLRHAAVTRAGLSTPYHLEVVRPGGFDGPVTLAVSRAFFDRFDFQNFYPNPSSETADAEYVVYEFDPPTGSVFTWSFDVKTSPNQLGSMGRYVTQLRDDDGRVEAELSFRMIVVP